MTNSAKATICRQDFLPTVKGAYFGPCCGRDIKIAFDLFSDTITQFVFCDINLRLSASSAQGMVPADWKFQGLVPGDNDLPSVRKFSDYTGGDRGVLVQHKHEFWRRPDGIMVTVSFLRDLAEDVLVEQFGPGSIAAFLHAHDGIGEGGSNMWFLGGYDEEPNRSPTSSDRNYLPELSDRLAEGAIVVTDGRMTHSQFQQGDAGELAGRHWAPLSDQLGPLSRIPFRYSDLVFWRSTKIKPQDFRQPIDNDF